MIASGERPLTVARGTMPRQGSPGQTCVSLEPCRGTATPGRTIAPSPTETLREKPESAAVVSSRGSCFDTGIDDESEGHGVEFRELFGELDCAAKKEFSEMDREILNFVSALWEYAEV